MTSAMNETKLKVDLPLLPLESMMRTPMRLHHHLLQKPQLHIHPSVEIITNYD